MFFDHCQLSYKKFKLSSRDSLASHFWHGLKILACLYNSSPFAPFSLVSYGARGEVISTFTINQMKDLDYCPHNLVLGILS